MTTRSPLDVALDSLRDAVRQAEKVLASRGDKQTAPEHPAGAHRVAA